MRSDEVTIYTDGASRGNPGQAAIAYVIRGDGIFVEHCDVIGRQTNNFAEYTAMVRALQRAAELGVKRLRLFSDSELMVRQMRGEYRVKNVDILSLYDQAQELLRRFQRVEFNHVAREQNSEADRLCNEALDGRPRPSVGAGPVADGQADGIDAMLTALLESLQDGWASGSETPTPAEAWREIKKLLEQKGLLKKSTKRRKPV